MILFGVTIKPIKEAKAELEKVLQQGRDLLIRHPENYPALVPTTPPERSREGSLRPTGCTFKRP